VHGTGMNWSRLGNVEVREVLKHLDSLRAWSVKAPINSMKDNLMAAKDFLGRSSSGGRQTIYPLEGFIDLAPMRLRETQVNAYRT